MKKKGLMEIKPYIITILITLCIFTICATTSPLYGFCDESHCFFSVGKAIMNGRVLYKDILEQKGLLIYLIQIPAYLISHTSFLGVWIIQCILVTISVVFSYKIAFLTMQNSFYAIISTTLMYLIVFTSSALASAQTVEVYLLPCFSYALFCSLKYLSTIDNIPKRVLLVNGVLAGIILWTKYSLLGFYFVWMATLCIVLLLKGKYKDAVLNGVIFVVGMLIVSLPCVVYFYLNGAMADLLKYYIEGNIGSYGTQITLKNLISGYIETVVFQLKNNFLFAVILAMGVIGIVINRFNLFVKINILCSVIAQFLIVYLHGPMFSYYFFSFAAFVILGTASILQIIRGFLVNRIDIKKMANKIVVLYGIICILGALLFKPSPRQFLQDPSDLAQYKFAQIMRGKEVSPTLLEYGYLDGGFYTVADIVPNTWAYCKLNWDSKEMIEDQLNTVTKQLTDFVVTRSGVEIPEALPKNYNLIAEKTQYRVDTQYTYYLWQKKGM